MTTLSKTDIPKTLKRAFFAAIIAYLVVPALLNVILRASTTEIRVSDFAAQQRRNSSAIATILGEFRTNLSDMLFIKTERYLHGGVAYMPHIDTDQLASSGAVEHTGQTSDKETSRTAEQETSTSGTKVDKEHHEEVATLIRPPEKDFRGFIGALEREVKPWRDPRLPHEHRGGVELLPWYRLATLVDPMNVRAYMIGAWWLKTLHSDHALREALKFLEEGLRHNPKAFQLELMRGYILRDLGDKRGALSAFEKAYELMKTQRPPDGQISARWTHYNEEDAIAAATLSVLQLREVYENDIEGLKACLERLAKMRQEITNMPTLERLERSLKAQLEAAQKTKS